MKIQATPKEMEFMHATCIWTSDGWEDKHQKQIEKQYPGVPAAPAGVQPQLFLPQINPGRQSYLTYHTLYLICHISYITHYILWHVQFDMCSIFIARERGSPQRSSWLWYVWECAKTFV